MTNQTQTEKILVWILRIGLVATLAAPLIVDYDYFFPFIVPRATYFQAIASGLFLVSALLLLFFPHARPKKNWISRALLLYFLIAIIATITSVDPGKSFIGTIERDLGLYHMLNLGAVFLAAVLSLRTVREWNIFFAIAVAVSLYPTADFIIDVAKSTGTMPQTIMGNPTFLAAYGVLHIFFGGYLITQTKNKILKILLAAVIAFEVVTTIFTGVRGGFVGLSAAALFLIVSYAWKHVSWRMPLIGLCLILIAAYGLVYVNRDHQLLQKNYIVQRMTDFSLENETIKARLVMWRTAWEGFKENPILGWGRENFSIVFNTHFQPAFNQAGVGEGWEDRTHNIFIDELVHGGILGLAVYLALFVAIFLAVRKEIVLLGLFIAYVIQGMFGVESLNSYLLFFLWLAFLVVRSGETKEPSLVRKLSPMLSYIAAFTVILIVLISTYLFTIQPAQGNKNMFRSFFAMATNNFPEFEKHYAAGKEYFELFQSLKVEAIAILTNGILGIGEQLAQIKTYPIYADKITNDLSPLTNRLPAEQRWAFVLAQLYLQRAIVENDNDRLVKANDIIQTLIAVSPQRNIFNKLKNNAQQVRYYFIQQQEAAKKAEEEAKKKRR